MLEHKYLFRVLIHCLLHWHKPMRILTDTYFYLCLCRECDFPFYLGAKEWYATGFMAFHYTHHLSKSNHTDIPS